MRAIERKSMWHHTIFSAVLCIILIALLLVRRDVSSWLIGGLIILYVAGNSLLHYWHKDFHKETLWEYLLIGAAVFIVLLGALNH